MERLLNKLRRGDRESGLSNIRKLASFFLNPEKNLRFIHIGGTNGKGSTSTKVAEAIGMEYKVGLFTSPHLFSFEERIAVNGEKITREDAQKGIDEIYEAERKLGLDLSFFEITVMLALNYFYEKRVDFVVFEVGIGGRLDITNIVTPILSVITSIDLDHMEVLGDTKEEIAKEKAGIIKEGVAVVLGPGVDFPIVRKVAREKGAEIILVEKTGGFYDDQNSLIAKRSLLEFQKLYRLSDASIEVGIKKRPRCRFEIVRKEGVCIVLDVSHNRASLLEFFKAISINFPKREISIVFGLSKNKPLDECVSVVSSFAGSIYVVDNGDSKLIRREVLFERFLKEGGSVFSFEDIKSSIKKAFLESKKKGGIIGVCGSFYIMKDAFESIASIK